MASKIASRSPKMDIIRIFALYTVTAVHFFLSINYLEQPINSPRMYVMTVMRTFFMICVPLFIMLSGYLMNNKKLSKRYYLGIVKTLGIYILACGANYIYRILYLKEDISFLMFCAGIFDYSIAPYAWYVEMYIGLFLIIPFINLSYNNLGSKKHKQILIITAVFLTAAPGIANIWNPVTPGFFATPSVGKYYIKLIPDWWKNFYPVTYYLLGCYLKEYGLGISKSKNIVLLILSVLCGGLFNIYRSYPLEFIGGVWQEWGSLINVINTVLVFNLLLFINDENVPAKLHKPLKTLSDITFGAYLMSWVFDNLFYAKLCAAIPEIPMRLEYFIVMPLLTFVCSIAASFVLNIIYNFIYRTVSKYILKLS